MRVILILVKQFWDVCTLRKGPADMPAYKSLLIVIYPLWIILELISDLLFISSAGVLQLLWLNILYSTGLLLLVVLIMLAVGCATRLLQTLIAITGAHVMISLVLLPGTLVVTLASVQGSPLELMLLIANTWRLAVYIHIFRQALSINLLLAAMLSIGYFLFSVWFAMYLIKLDV